MKKFLSAVTIAGFSMSAGLYAQTTTSQLVHNRLRLIASGAQDSVRHELPSLLGQYPSDPGVRFLSAVIMANAIQALAIYEEIVKNYPQSEWADDAQWRIVQYYALTDTARARAELDSYRRNYPGSEFLLMANESVESASAGQEKRVVSSDPGGGKPPRDTAPAPRRVISSDNNPVPLNERNNSSGKRYGYQVAAFSSRDKADSESKKYDAFRVSVIEKKIGAEIRYAVVLGNYPTREFAENERSRVEKICGCKPIILEK